MVRFKVKDVARVRVQIRDGVKAGIMVRVKIRFCSLRVWLKLGSGLGIRLD